MTWHVGGEDAYYELPLVWECDGCGNSYFDRDECTVCLEADARDEEAA